MMRRITLLVAVVGVMLVGFVPTAGANPVSRPFHAVLSGTGTFDVDTTGTCTAPPGWSVNQEATGTAWHMGLTTMTSMHCAALAFEGTGSLVAANGDELFFDYLGDGPPVGPDIGTVYRIDADFQIVDGTGRFQGAVGEGDLTLYVVFEGYVLPSVWPATYIWDGTISY